MFDFVVTPDGGEPYQIKAGPRDVLAWEKAHKGASLRALMEEARMGQLYQLAYYASKRQGKYTGTLTEFEDTCDVDSPEPDDEGDADPTQPEA